MSGTEHKGSNSQGQGFWACDLAEAGSDFTGYEIQYALRDINYGDEYPADCFYWRTERNWHEESLGKFLENCERPLFTDEGRKRITSGIPTEDRLENPRYEFEAYRVVDGRYADTDDCGCEIPAYERNPKPLGFPLIGTWEA